MNIAKFLRRAFLWYTFCSLYFSKILYDNLEIFGYQIDIFYFSCTIVLLSFITLVLESGVHGYFVLVFIPKFLVSITFAGITTSAPALLLQW